MDWTPDAEEYEELKHEVSELNPKHLQNSLGPLTFHGYGKVREDAAIPPAFVEGELPPVEDEIQKDNRALCIDLAKRDILLGNSRNTIDDVGLHVMPELERLADYFAARGFEIRKSLIVEGRGVSSAENLKNLQEWVVNGEMLEWCAYKKGRLRCDTLCTPESD